jgi:hypothetical protein
MQRDEKSWLGRNWPFVLALGCLVTCLCGVLVPVGCVMGLGSVAFTALGESDVVDEALERAAADPRVGEALGLPLERGWFVRGSLEYRNGGGEADLTVPLEGPRSEATLFLEAVRREGEWVFERLAVELEATGERIDLLEAPADQQGELEWT